MPTVIATMATLVNSVFTYVGVGEAVEQREEKSLEAGETEGGEGPEPVRHGRRVYGTGDGEDVVGTEQRQQHQRSLHRLPARQHRIQTQCRSVH